jgi:putative DNA primase/helicase
MGDDGLVQRFQIAVYPEASRDWRNVDRWPDTDARRRAYTIFERLDEIDPVELDAKREHGDLPYVRFTAEAQELFDAWRARLERRLRAGADHPVIVSHLAKYRSLFPSLALLFHLVDHAAGAARGAVTLDAAALAEAWCGYLERHALRIYSTVTAGANVSAHALAAKITAGALPSAFTERDVRRNGWSALAEADDVKRALDVLESVGWVREHEDRKTGGRPKTMYHLNPRLPRRRA